VRDVALDLSPLVADKALDFELSTGSTPVLVRAHRWMLQELSRNLLHNAVKHSPHGGALTVRVQAIGDEAVLTVTDQGRGISEDLRQRLFAPFAAGDVASGSGLGLAICHEIVLALQGRISLDNRESGGQTVGLDAVVRLPLTRDNR
jgi:two-component system sensor histidine kinase TctE